MMSTSSALRLAVNAHQSALDKDVMDTMLAAADEIERLTACLKEANANAEKFEREWYLRGDENERLQSKLSSYRATLEEIARRGYAGASFVAQQALKDSAVENHGAMGGRTEQRDTRQPETAADDMPVEAGASPSPARHAPAPERQEPR
jgi:chromosome segregation ATPase